KTATTVCPHHDQVGLPLLRLLDDQIGRSAANRFEQDALRLERMLPDDTFRLAEHCFALCPQGIDDLAHVDRRRFRRCRQDQLVYYMNQLQLRTVTLSEPERLAQPKHRGCTAINRDEYLHVHVLHS